MDEILYGGLDGWKIELEVWDGWNIRWRDVGVGWIGCRI